MGNGNPIKSHVTYIKKKKKKNQNEKILETNGILKN